MSDISKSKIFVLDTNVMVHDPDNFLQAFEDNTIVLSIKSLEELDNLKIRQGEAGYLARTAARHLETLRIMGSFHDGIRTQGGGMIRVDLNGYHDVALPEGLAKDKADNIILKTALGLYQKHRGEREVILVSKDINLRLKANAVGVPAEDYKFDKVENVDKLFRGTVDIEDADDLIQELMSGQRMLGGSNVADERHYGESLHSHTCCFLRSSAGGSAILAIYEKEDKIFRWIKKNRGSYPLVVPKNDEQIFSYELGLDPSILLMAFTGIAGTGKTLMALRAGMEQLGKRYKKMVVFRPTKEVGEPLGYLPGSIEEKFAPWQRPIITCLNRILGGSQKSSQSDQDQKIGSYFPSHELIQSRLVEILPLNYIRGDTIDDAFIIFDEAQNSNAHIIKTLITRAGETSKVVLTGDLGQIDDKYLDIESSGLSIAVSAFTGKSEFAHLQLVKSERGRLAQMAAHLL